jgi:hypothetical protein
VSPDVAIALLTIVFAAWMTWRLIQTVERSDGSTTRALIGLVGAIFFLLLLAIALLIEGPVTRLVQ